MNVDLRLGTSEFCYVYSKYKIAKFNSKDYILPEENATKKKISLTEYINEILVDTLNIGKKVFYEETIEQTELLDYYERYGSFGFIIDLAINKYFILEDKVAIRDAFYINNKENIDFINIDEYLKYFFPTLNKRDLNILIKKCRNTATDIRKEDYLTSMINEYLIYSEHYAEPTDLVLNYVRALYKNLISTIEHKPLTMKLPFLDVNHLEYNIDDLYYNNSFGFKINYLKQAIDVYYRRQMGQDVRLLKVCNYCKKAFIAKNPKAEYDTYNCKNKANVYKSRAKSSNVVHTETGLAVKIPSKELFDENDKKLKNKKNLNRK